MKSYRLAAEDYPWVTEDLFISLQEGLDDDNALIMPHDGEVSPPSPSIDSERGRSTNLAF